jgi:hypothetical protein
MCSRSSASFAFVSRSISATNWSCSFWNCEQAGTAVAAAGGYDEMNTTLRESRTEIRDASNTPCREAPM